MGFVKLTPSSVLTLTLKPGPEQFTITWSADGVDATDGTTPVTINSENLVTREQYIAYNTAATAADTAATNLKNSNDSVAIANATAARLQADSIFSSAQVLNNLTNASVYYSYTETVSQESRLQHILFSSVVDPFKGSLLNKLKIDNLISYTP
jgi:hypothetical protein